MRTANSDGTFGRFVRLTLSRKVVLVGVVVILVLIVLAIFAPLIAPHDPYKQDLSLSLHPPSWEYPFGTDKFGRDALSRLIYGTRIALMVGIVAVSISATIGILLAIAVDQMQRP